MRDGDGTNGTPRMITRITSQSAGKPNLWQNDNAVGMDRHQYHAKEESETAQSQEVVDRQRSIREACEADITTDLATLPDGTPRSMSLDSIQELARGKRWE